MRPSARPQDLDLSCNNIGVLANLGACSQLTALDLSNNCLSCLARAAQICGGLRRLVLRARAAPSAALLVLRCHVHSAARERLLFGPHSPSAPARQLMAVFKACCMLTLGLNAARSCLCGDYYQHMRLARDCPV